MALGGDSFELAERAVASLGEAGEVAVPALLRALGDSRATRFAKVRRGPRGLSVVRAEAPSAILVRHVAGALLERLLGPPPVPRPSAADWEAWWKGRDRG